MKKIILSICGIISLALGVIGIFLPVLPTTPFVLLSANLFVASSPRLYKKLIKNKMFGSIIENYRNKTGVPIKVKIRAIVFLWVGLILSMLLLKAIWIILILFVVGTGVTIHLVTLKTRND
ncbi:YbaN family protein [Mobilitalea sibirica]|uniref:YbaN family protein n=1 Tax=Mobilitalea sibirica TaxID=1462919 RepID=A0A8J7L2N1_9FIRM|nr:YbaN family protein [Mobilitalea sibirica]MBH1941003.1 YbaN family protein [Mobilitalea sibirica]